MPRIETEPKLDFHQVLITPKRSNLNSRSEVILERTFTFKNGQQWTGIPIICANMSSTGTFEVYDELSKHKIITAFHKFYDYSDYVEHMKKCEERQCVMDPDYFMVSTGISDADYEKLVNLCNLIPVKWICIDIANGYIPNLLTFCKKVRVAFPDKIIVAGNVATPDIVNTLCLEGDVDIVKCGIGPGSACTTRLKTGVGMPQLSCIMDCGDAAHGVNKYIIGDGGITCPGDLSKAFCGGADFVMIGGILAGHDECDGEVENGVMKFYGMASESAMDRHGNHNNYRGAEGKTVEIPYRGKVDDTIKDILSGIRSACTYVGANRLKTLSKCTTFVRVHNTHNTIYED